jgi:hypothetical protein
VFAGSQELNDCFGTSGAQVVLHDASGQTITLETNPAGNFYYAGSIAFPIDVEVVHGGATRAMPSPVSDGDCNSCHTASGDQGAPGRILLP